jgi:hypothetical protein
MLSVDDVDGYFALNKTTTRDITSRKDGEINSLRGFR